MKRRKKKKNKQLSFCFFNRKEDNTLWWEYICTVRPLCFDNTVTRTMQSCTSSHLHVCILYIAYSHVQESCTFHTRATLEKLGLSALLWNGVMAQWLKSMLCSQSLSHHTRQCGLVITFLQKNKKNNGK